VQPRAFRTASPVVFAAEKRSGAVASKQQQKRAVELLSGPQPDTVAAFFDKSNEARQIHAALVVVCILVQRLVLAALQFILCESFACEQMAKIDGQEYGIGFPIGTPVAITRRKGDQFEAIVPGDEDFFDAFQAFSSHLQSYDLELCPTAKVLTLEVRIILRGKWRLVLLICL
jgi:hypothetical protein